MTSKLSDGYRRVRRAIRPRTRWRAWRHRQNLARLQGTGSPAEFAEWTRRSEGRRSGGFPHQWRSRTDLPIKAPAEVCVLVHAFYADLLDPLLRSLRDLPVGFDLIVTNATGSSIHLPPDMGRLRNARVLEVENRGRDILPLASVVNAGYLDPYSLVLKVHTKRSDWRSDHESLTGDGIDWRKELLGAVLGGPENTATILSAFAEQPDLGLVTADGSVLDGEFWGDNQANTACLLRRLELDLDPESLRFAAGSIYWARGFLLQGLRALNLSRDDFEPERNQVNATTAHAVERLIGLVAHEAGLRIVERSAVEHVSGAPSWQRFEAARSTPRARIVPFYLPQFHPIEENDKWWGTGFTEWTNVTVARPVFHGHHQPRLPGDLGFYDLRLDEVRRAQHSMAADAGIEGFMYYYYWFAGTRLLDGPIEALLKSDLPQPFCVMWANENWTRRWDGRDADVLIAQDEDSAVAARFIDDIVPALVDERYMTIDGRKIVAVYRPGLIEGFDGVVAAWRQRAKEAGAGELFVMGVDVGRQFDGLDGTRDRQGLDALLGFPPHNHLYSWLHHQGLGVDPRFRGNLLSFAELVNDAEGRLRSGCDPKYFPGVMVAFDNTPRRQWTADIWFGSNPYTFRRWLASAVEAVLARPQEERLVFVNAWNEWAEGAALEPSDRFGRTFLLAVRDVAFG